MKPVVKQLKDIPWNKVYGMNITFVHVDAREKAYSGVWDHVWRPVRVSWRPVFVFASQLTVGKLVS